MMKTILTIAFVVMGVATFFGWLVGLIPEARAESAAATLVLAFIVVAMCGGFDDD